MKAEPAGFPRDWIESGSEPATDLDLALLLVNTMDLLEHPPDRLVDMTWVTSAFAHVGHGQLAAELSPRDLPRLRRLRDSLRVGFESRDPSDVVAALNPMLEKARAVPLLVERSGGDRPVLAVGVGRRGVAALEARLPAAVAAHVAAQGVSRLGVCASDPCRCAFVDRTRAGTRKYCCTLCNDRYSARAYRRRQI